MADKKISEMTAASAYTGTNEFYEIVQGGNTRQGSHDLLKAYFDTLYAPAQVRFTSTAQTITSGGSLTIAHGLGAAPFIVGCYLKCTTAQAGYSIGDILYVGFTDIGINGADNWGVSVSRNGTTNLDIRFGSSANVFVAPRKDTGVTAQLTNTSWRFYVYAQK